MIMKKKIISIIIIVIILVFIGVAALWFKSRFKKDSTLKVIPTGTLEAGGPEE